MLPLDLQAPRLFVSWQAIGTEEERAHPRGDTGRETGWATEAAWVEVGSLGLILSWCLSMDLGLCEPLSSHL